MPSQISRANLRYYIVGFVAERQEFGIWHTVQLSKLLFSLSFFRGAVGCSRKTRPEVGPESGANKVAVAYATVTFWGPFLRSENGLLFWAAMSRRAGGDAFSCIRLCLCVCILVRILMYAFADAAFLHVWQ